MIIKELSKEYSKIEKKLYSINNYLYNNPELGYQEFKSTKKIIQFLKETVRIKDFEYFMKPSDLRVQIQFIVRGSELENMGRLISEEQIWPDPEIFHKESQSSYFDGNKMTPNTPSITKTLMEETNGDQDEITINTSVITNEEYPEYFGDLICTGKVSIVEIMSNIKGKKSTTVGIYCRSDSAIVQSEYLGNFSLKKNESWKIKIKNLLGSKKKNTADLSLPKRKFEQIVSPEETLQRAKDLAKQL